MDGVSGNAAKSGIKPGDTIIYASSFFGDELWPADKLSFTQTAIQRAPSPVAFVYVSVTDRRGTYICWVVQTQLGSGGGGAGRWVLVGALRPVTSCLEQEAWCLRRFGVARDLVGCRL